MFERIDQMLAGFSEGDAITSEAQNLRQIFKRWGIASDIFVDTRHVSAGLLPECRPLEEHRGNKASLLIHHYSIGSPAVEAFLRSSSRKVLHYHNVTPAHFFAGFDDRIARELEDARGALANVIPRVDAMWAVSRFNAAELESLGAREVAVFPLQFSGSEMSDSPSDVILGKFSVPMTNILFVGRIVPNKRVEDLMQAYCWYHRTINRQSRLILVGSDRSAPAYFVMLRMLAGEWCIPNVCFERYVNFRDLPTYYRIADVFATASRHEGFCRPLIEAMSFDVPVVANRAGGIPEALGSAGIMYEDASPAELAVLLDRVVTDRGLRSEVIESQRRRMAEIAGRNAEAELRSLVERLA